jgi:hypothetical protein
MQVVILALMTPSNASVQPPLRAPVVQRSMAILDAKIATILARSGRLERVVGRQFAVWALWVPFAGFLYFLSHKLRACCTINRLVALTTPSGQLVNINQHWLRVNPEGA